MSKKPAKLIWSDAHEKLYKQLFNKLIEINNKIKIESYLLNYNKRNLMKFIKDLPLSDSTKESFLFMVARYLELNKPIIAFVTEGSQKIFLEKSGVANIINPDGLIKNNLFEVLAKKKTLNPNLIYLSNFSRKKLTEKLSRIIDLR